MKKMSNTKQIIKNTNLLSTSGIVTSVISMLSFTRISQLVAITSFSSLTILTNATSLQPLSEKQLAETTAQDGLSIKVQNNNGLGIQSLRIIQKDVSFETNNTAYNQAAAIGINFTADKNILFCESTQASETCNVANNILQIEIDTDGGADSAGAFVNARITSGAKSVYIPLKSVNLLGGMSQSNNQPTSYSNDIELMNFSDGVKINSNQNIAANLQLGSQPQGSMLVMSLNDGSYLDIDLGTIEIYSHNADMQKASKISTDVSINGFNKQIGNTKATNTKIDIDAQKGLVISKDRATIEKINMLNTKIGDTVQPSANIFNGLQNSSIGDISLQNITINGLEIGINGL